MLVQTFLFGRQFRAQTELKVSAMMRNYKELLLTIDYYLKHLPHVAGSQFDA